MEDYKDDFVNRLSVFRSFETNASTIAPRQSHQSNPLTSKSLNLRGNSDRVKDASPPQDLLKLFEYVNKLYTVL